MRDWIVAKEMNFDDACRGNYEEEYLACSHRWLTDGTANPSRAPPDPKGQQLTAITGHLATHTKIKYVWVDWFCMWQGGKDGQRDITVDERGEFELMLGEVNLLYLGCQVLVLLDLSYLSRFWTMYEAWLSRLQPTAQGLKLAQGDAAARCQIVPILSASSGFSTALTDTIAEKMATPESAASFLQSDDISVTNVSDKVKQLAKVGGLNERVRNVLTRDAAMVKVHDTACAEPMDAAALRSAVEEAEGVGVGREKLEDARRVLMAVADRPVTSREEVLRAENRLLKDELEQQRGAVLGAMMLAGVTTTVARASGYNLNELKAAGFVEGLKDAGYTCNDLKSAGFSSSEAARARFAADEAQVVGYIKNDSEAISAGFIVIPLDGLEAWFKPERFSVSDGQWQDASAHGHIGKCTQGSLAFKKYTGEHGAQNSVSAVFGDAGTSFDFGPVIKHTFTIASVCRYTGSGRQRILQGTRSNWLHSHHGGDRGVAHYDAWNTRTGKSVCGEHDWVLMIGQNGGDFIMRANGQDVRR